MCASHGLCQCMQEPSLSASNKAQLSNIENFLSALHGSSKVDQTLAMDAGNLLKILKADTAQVERIKDAVQCLEKFSQTLVRFAINFTQLTFLCWRFLGVGLGCGYRY